MTPPKPLPTPLETERLILRAWTEDDLEPFYRLGTDPEILRYLGGDRLESREAAIDLLRTRPLRDYAVHGYGRMAVVEKSSGQVIGFSGLKYLEELKLPDIGYRFVPESWGKGYATESSREAMRHGRDVLKLPKIVGMVDPKNAASVRVLVKLGLAFTKKIKLEMLGEDLWDLYE